MPVLTLTEKPLNRALATAQAADSEHFPTSGRAEGGVTGLHRALELQVVGSIAE